MEEQWGEWIEWNGGECPIPNVLGGDFEIKVGPSSVCSFGGQMVALYRATDFDLNWRYGEGVRPITAYRLKRTADAYCVKLDASQVGAPSTGHAIQPPSNGTRHHTPKPIPADFIPWHGQGVPSIPAGTRIKYLTRSGADGETAVHFIGWSHDGGPMDVIAYRPLIDADAQMLLRDMAEHKPRPVCASSTSMSREDIKAFGRAVSRRWLDAAVSAAAWVESPRDHRLGNFN